MNADVVAMVLAGGRGTRLNLIAAKRAKPAVPFAGMYRIIDFTLSNVMASGIRHAGVLTQYRPTSLMEHLGDGDAWDLAGRTASLSVLPPSLGSTSADWYRGTADAIYQNLSYLRHLDPKHVLILSGDHIYHMDYRPMIARHVESGADLTIAAMEVPWEETHRFGVMITDERGEVVRFVEKTRDRVSNLASMGLYVFKPDVLVEELNNASPAGKFDFGSNVIPEMLGRRKVVSHLFRGYWRDVGTLPSYWAANMDTLCPSSGVDLASWSVRTNLSGRGQVYHAPAWFGPEARVSGSLVSRGCIIEGEVIDSVLSPGIHVGRGARVVASVVMHDGCIGDGATVARSILDKDVVVGPGTRIGREDAAEGENRLFPTHLYGGLSVVGKGTVLPGGLAVGANCLVGADVPAERFAGLGGLPDGESLI